MKVSYYVGRQPSITQLDAQKLLKISDKMLLGQGISIPEPVHVRFIKGEELHANLEPLVQEYNFASF
jgi:hypothetical protein